MSIHRFSLPRSLAAFTLVEVMLALGICSTCFVGILGLLPVGISTNRDSVEQTAAVGIARAVVADLRASSSGASTTTLFNISLPGASTSASSVPAQTFFFTETGSCSSAIDAASSRYRVDIAYGARSSAAQPAPVRILVSWPALANPKPGQWPTHQTGSYQVLSALNIQ